MNKIKNKSFFVTPTASVIKQQHAPCEDKEGIPQEGTMNQDVKPTENCNINRVQLRKNLIDSIKNAVQSLKAIGMAPLATEIIHLYNKVLEERFTIAFVGEFNRGKSTLINRLLNTDILPTSDLPTTALLTRITYGEPKMTVWSPKENKSKELSLCKQSWEGLTASNFGEKEPEGRVLISMKNNWLKNYPIDILDTPGAGDLEVKRAKVIGQALMCTDAAVMAVSAASPLSLTEQSFIKQKILSTKIPFMALVITKLDEVKFEERDNVVRFIRKKLTSLKMNLPIVVADDNVKMPTDEFKSIVGVDKLKALLKIWLSNENRANLTEQWLTSNVQNVLNIAHGVLLQQKQLIMAKDDERENLINQKLIALSKVHEQWQDLRDQMVNRCHKCVNEFTEKVDECGATIIERLQHELDRMPSAKSWVEKEYSYRVKSELAAVSLTLDSITAKHVSNDLRWLNNQLSNQFKMAMNLELGGLDSKESFFIDLNEKSVQLDDLTKRRTQTTLTTVAITLGASLALASCGGFIPLATLGLGTGANMLANTVFSKKAEKQKEQVKKIIADTIPNIVKEASSDCIVKIKMLYNDIISEALNSERKWMQTQRTLIRDTNKPQNEETAKSVLMHLEKIEILKKQFN